MMDWRPIDEIFEAVGKIKVVSWEAIYRQRFPLTPQGLYNELCRNADSLLKRQKSEAARRTARLLAFETEELSEEEEAEMEMLLILLLLFLLMYM